jgi:hypothetical protein
MYGDYRLGKRTSLAKQRRREQLVRLMECKASCKKSNVDYLIPGGFLSDCTVRFFPRMQIALTKPRRRSGQNYQPYAERTCLV